MSRLGDMIKQERLRAGWSHKQLAKKSGVSEKFLVEVEAGTRIIADTQATRILKVLGKTSEFIADFEGKADGVPTPEPVRAAPRPAPGPRGAPLVPSPWQRGGRLGILLSSDAEDVFRQVGLEVCKSDRLGALNTLFASRSGVLRG